MEISPAESKMLLDPNNLGPDVEASGFEPRGDFRRVNTGMPDVGDVSWEQPVGRRPVDLIVIEDSATLPRLPQSGALAPLGVILHTIGRISEKPCPRRRRIEQPVTG